MAVPFLICDRINEDGPWSMSKADGDEKVAQNQTPSSFNVWDLQPYETSMIDM